MQLRDCRVEKDFLGERHVPGDVYYGIQTLRAAENFPITGYRLHERLIQAFAMVKLAAARANRMTLRLEPRIGLAIEQAAAEIIAGQWHDQFVVDPLQGGAGTSINMNTNEVLANRAIELLGGVIGDYGLVSPNTHVNMSQSTNDCFPTAAHIAAASLIDELLHELRLVQDTFAGKAQEFDSVIKMGRTHLQDAVPIRLGQEFEAYARVAKRDILRIERTRANLLEINMGATAIGTGLNADPLYVTHVVQELADISGLPLRQAEHLPDATQNTDVFTEISSALKVCMINMSKIANDLRLMASGPRAGLGEIQLPSRQPGSSIMPGKVNPVMCEIVNQVAFQVIGNDHTICLASEAGQLELNVMEPVMVYNLLQSLSMMKQTFSVFRQYCLEGITANAERCRQYVEQSVGVMTALNPYLGYEASAMIASEALKTGRSVREMVLYYDLLDENQLDAILDPFQMTSPGIAGEKSL
ncbi:MULTISPECIES: aspartate ammonia-lyase [unclassified Paenibacillus]|uniref:aspartate ammonia-lyase n=1 Tax=unclassified Paenibacillus TaxID=185978 RepID=UPI002406241E|nr:MULTISPECIES: aspartate ammonia-lyase [unclassified Paenibacillus]MDF9839497.1 aspartate ammonia-lyase [Paenibacillus sp. PastF-2]MDF9846078.1 aspartate ammonia-lyase [Paenibacillus sp. PastM-2]MDF9852651.1 aspartate ammonia-lyase [Paenibacillus sp. PastF-1]MDH6477618.1 aspartate ammonia-lyase [Paenibacillus sp. PastH-2]MDH6505361.1 aspartate ammonia-lyase [Paenibacillus sp. PastM-3]